MIADVIEEDTMSDEIYAEEALPMSYAAVLSDTPAAPGTPVDVVFLLQSAGTREFDFNTQRTMIKDVMCMLQRSHGKENIRVCVIAFDTLGATIISPDTWFTDSDELQTALSELTYSSKGWSVADRGAAFSKLIFEVEFKKTASKFVFHLVNGLSTVGSGYPDQLAACSQLPINYSELVVEEYRSGSPQYMEEVAKAIAKTNGINLPFNPGTSTATVYNHICEYTAATPLPITEYMVTIANSWKKITLKKALDPDSDTDTDDDGLRDWDEVNNELISFDSDGSPKLLKFDECTSLPHRRFVNDGLRRFYSSLPYPTTGNILYDILYHDLYVLPIISDPTEVDSDGDELLDSEDEQKLIPNKWFIYSRDEAVNYAHQWYNDINEEFYSYKSDCANFVSQCLLAGGGEMTDEWHSYKLGEKDKSLSDHVNVLSWFSHDKYKYHYDWDVSQAWRSAPDLYKYYANEKSLVETITISREDDLSKIINENNIQAGDLMFLDDDGDGTPNHATIISSVVADSGSILYAAHTKPRDDYDVYEYYLSENKKYRAIIIKIRGNKIVYA